GADPDVETLFRQQARETDRKKREAMLNQIQQMLYDRARFGPVYEFIWASGIGPRVAEPGLMLIDPYPWAAPLEDGRLKTKWPPPSLLCRFWRLPWWAATRSPTGSSIAACWPRASRACAGRTCGAFPNPSSSRRRTTRRSWPSRSWSARESTSSPM